MTRRRCDRDRMLDPAPVCGDGVFRSSSPPEKESPPRGSAPAALEGDRKATQTHDIARYTPPGSPIDKRAELRADLAFALTWVGPINWHNLDRAVELMLREEREREVHGRT